MDWTSEQALVQISREGTFDGASIASSEGTPLAVEATRLRQALVEYLRSSSVLRALHIAHLDVSGALDLSDVDFGSSARFLHCGFQGTVQLARATIEGELLFQECRFSRGLAAEQLRCGGGLCLRGSRFDENLDLNYSQVTGNALLQQIVVGGDFYAYGAVFRNDIALQDGDFFRRVDFSSADIGGTVGVEGSVFKARIYFDSAKVGRNLFLREAKFLDGLHLTGVHVGHHLQLRQSLISGPVDLTEAHIGKELHLERDTAKGPPIWREGSVLILRNARARTLAGSLSAFKVHGVEKFVELDLVGFRYDNLGGLGGRGNEGAQSAPSLAMSPPRDLVRFLAAGTAGWGEFAPDPYLTLATTLRRAGQNAHADMVLVELGHYERRSRSTALSRRVALHLLGSIIGFGYRNHYALFWLLLLIGIGAAPALLPSATAPILEFLRFSFGNSIAIVSFDEGPRRFAELAFAGNTTAQDLYALALYAQRVIGFVLITYLAAGIAGLASRKN